MCNVFFYIGFLVFFCIHDVYALNETSSGGGAASSSVEGGEKRYIKLEQPDYTVFVPSDKGVPITINSSRKQQVFENGVFIDFPSYYLGFGPHDMSIRRWLKRIVDLQLEKLALKEKIVELEELKGKKEKLKAKKEEIRGKKKKK